MFVKASTFGGGGGGGGSSFNPQGSAPTIFGGGGNPQTVTSPFSGAGPGTFGNSNNLSSFRAGAVPTPFSQSSPNSNGSSAFGNNNFGANNTVGGFGNSNQAPLLTTNSYQPLREPQSTKNGPPEQLIYVDIDETICFYSGDRRYDLSEPNFENIAKINKLYDEGWKIVYWTARGAKSGIDYYEHTKNQLDEWGCKYHDLVTGTSENPKPSYDLIIDDKAKRIEEL